MPLTKKNRYLWMPKKAGRRDGDASQSYARLLEASARLNRVMRQTDSRRHALDTLLAQSLRAFSADAAGTYEVRDGVLVFTAGRGLSTLPPSRLPADAPSVLSQALHSEDVLYFKVAEEEARDCDFCGFLAQQGMQSLLVTPLRTAQATIGVLFIALRREIPFSRGLRQLLNAFSETGGSTLHRFIVMNQLELTVANRDRELQVLYDLMAITAETSEMDTLLHQSLDRILLAVDCPVGVIHLVDAVDHRLKVAASAQYSEQFENYLELSGLSGQLWHKVYADQAQVQVRDLPDRSFPEVPNLEGQYYTYLGVPICIKGKAVGVLSLFGRPDLLLEAVGQLAKSAADELGLAVESGRLRKRAEDAVILHERQRLARNLHEFGLPVALRAGHLGGREREAPAHQGFPRPARGAKGYRQSLPARAERDALDAV